MFGSKEEKEHRLVRIVDSLRALPQLPAHLAGRLRVARSTILRDLRELEERGVLLQEDEYGILSLLDDRDNQGD